MKRMRRILFTALALCMVLTILTPCAGAAGGSYAITVHAGLRGSFGGRESVTGYYAYGSRVNLSDIAAGATVSAGNEKYAIKNGARPAGHDNNELIDSVEVTGDADYVLVYYVPGNMVEYTVRYVDAGGNALAGETKGYGNAGDKVTVGSKDIDGYVPRDAYNFAKTLSSNNAENVITFVYVKYVPPTPEVIEIPGGGGNAGGNAGNAAGTAEAGGVTEGQAGQTAPSGPVEYIDLDEQEVPLAEFGGEEEAGVKESENSSARTILFAGLALALGLLAAIIFFLLKNKKDEDNA